MHENIFMKLTCNIFKSKIYQTLIIHFASMQVRGDVKFN